MKKAMIDYIRRGTYDELYTPEVAIIPLLKYIPVEYTIWECTDFGGSNITKLFRKRGNKVIGTNTNFFEFEPEEDYDIIITNPPYSLKDEFLERAYQLNKPFCFLLPITALEGVKRGKLFREHGIQVLVLDRRVDFTGKKSNWFNVSWFCYKILSKDLVFESLSIG